jgi:hypothetical protein
VKLYSHGTPVCTGACSLLRLCRACLCRVVLVLGCAGAVLCAAASVTAGAGACLFACGRQQPAAVVACVILSSCQAWRMLKVVMR